MVKINYLDNAIIAEDMEDIIGRKVPWNDFHERKVLITGAGGMLGAYMVITLLWLRKYGINVQIYALVRNEQKFRSQFHEFLNDDQLHIIVSDLSEPIHLNINVDYIIHAASLASSQYYASKPMEVMTPNTIGTYYLLQYAKEKCVKGFLFFSSAEIYGALQGVQSITENTLGFVDPLDIRNCYSESKRAGEAMCLAGYIERGIPCKIARIFHTYAPTMDIENDKRVFSDFVRNIIQNQDIVMKSKGLSKRSFCYITDAIAALFLVLLCGKSGEAYNICHSEEFISISELAQRILSIAPEKGLKVIIQDREANDSYMENQDVGSIPPDNKKVRQLGAYFHVGIEEGFQRVIKFFQEQEK